MKLNHTVEMWALGLAIHHPMKRAHHGLKIHKGGHGSVKVHHGGGKHSIGHGAVGLKEKHHGVVSRSMEKRHGLTHVAADASPSDLASHHTWAEPSSTDTCIRKWQMKRALESRKGRNMDPFEADAELAFALAHRH